MKTGIVTNVRVRRSAFCPRKTLTILCSLLAVFLFSSVSARAQQPGPKIAVASVKTSDLLAKQSTNNSVSVVVPSTFGLEGVWDGTLQKPDKGYHITVTISKSDDGFLRAVYHDITKNAEWKPKPLQINGKRIQFSDPRGGGPDAFVEGDVNVMTGKWLAVFRKGKEIFPLSLTRVGGPVLGASTNSTTNVVFFSSVTSPELILHAMDVQLVDRVEKTKLFTVTANADLKQIVPAADLRSEGSLKQLKAAGVQYLLLTTLQEFSEQALDLAQEQITRQEGSVNLKLNSTSQRSPGSAQIDQRLTGVAKNQKIVGAAQIKREQIVNVTVQFELYDTATGNKLESSVQKFKTVRPYTALASGNNVLGQTDLFELAAQEVSERGTIMVSGAVFPIMVLDKNEKIITINRGSEAGIKVNQLYGVYSASKELKDPVTGRVLGMDEDFVGKVVIKDLRPQFSKALILDDKAITNGTRLRWMAK